MIVLLTHIVFRPAPPRLTSPIRVLCASASRASVQRNAARRSVTGRNSVLALPGRSAGTYRGQRSHGRLMNELPVAPRTFTAVCLESETSGADRTEPDWQQHLYRSVVHSSDINWESKIRRLKRIYIINVKQKINNSLFDILLILCSEQKQEMKNGHKQNYILMYIYLLFLRPRSYLSLYWVTQSVCFALCLKKQ